MLTEIFDERETTTQGPEPDTEALEIIAELGLKTEPDGERICYPQPNEQQWFAISMIFQQRTLLKDYDAGCIPLRVLKEIRSYKAEYPSHELVIFHQKATVVKDPILMGCTGASWSATYEGTGATSYRLIARWGDALEDWSKLAERAGLIVREQAIEQCEQAIRRLRVLLEEAPTMRFKKPFDITTFVKETP